MTITKDDLAKIAHLARLNIDLQSSSERFADRMAADLNNILKLVDQINEVDTTNISPMAHPLNRAQPTRPDQITETTQRELIQSIAPNNSTEAGLYLVPKVVE